jgi:hypothetical protein
MLFLRLRRRDIQKVEQRMAHLVEIGVDGTVSWDGDTIDGLETLMRRYKAAAVKQPQPAIYVKGDRSARYEDVGAVVGGAQRAGLLSISFVAHTLEVAVDGTVIWDGEPTPSTEDIERTLAITAAEIPRPLIYVVPHPLIDQVVANVVAIAGRVGLHNLRFVGNERHAPASDPAQYT